MTRSKIALALIAATTLTLTACHKGEHKTAVEHVATAEAEALAKTPKAEEIKFADHGEPTIGGVGGAAGANAATKTDTPAHIAGDLATVDAQTTAHHGQAEATATADAKTDTAKTDEAKPADAKPADTATADKADAKADEAKPADAPADTKAEAPKS